VHQTIRQVSHDLETFEFNTVVSALMELTNAIADAKEAGLAGHDDFREAIEMLLLMMAPITPHIAEELWSRLNKPYSVHTQSWPEFEEELAKEELITLVLQVNGKVRDRVEVAPNIQDEEARRLALENETVKKHLAGAEPRQVVVVSGRLVNVVT
jgi:leucyl-tRNA synthetase